MRRLEENAGTIDATARLLEQKYAGEKAQDAWKPGHTQDIAWESNQIARSDIYAALQIPVEACEPANAVCSNEPEVELNSTYLEQADAIAGNQLAKAGFRLASLLNEMWTEPVAPGNRNRATSEKISASDRTVSANESPWRRNRWQSTQQKLRMAWVRNLRQDGTPESSRFS